MNFEDLNQLEFMLRLVPSVGIYKKDIRINYYKKEDIENLFKIALDEDEYYKINGQDSLYISLTDIFRKLIKLEVQLEKSKDDTKIKEHKQKLFIVMLDSLCKYYGI